MTRFFEFLIALLLVALLFLLVGVFLPGHRHVRHSTETNHPLRQVFDTVNSFTRFGEWHPMRLHDPRIQYRLEGEPRGEGARLVYDSENPRIGAGSWEITQSEQDSMIEFTIDSPAYGFNKTAVFTFEEKGKTVDINWEYDVDYGWNIFGRYAGLYLTRTIGDDIKLGLSNLVGLLSTMPNFDYSSLDVEVARLEPQRMLLVSTTSDRNITAVEEAMTTALDLINEAVEANDLEAIGPPRLITTNFGSEKYEFDVGLPVQRATNDQDAIDDAASGDSGEAAAAREEMLADADAADRTTDVAGSADAGRIYDNSPMPPLPDLELPARVKQGHGYAGRAVMAQYEGHPAALPLVRDMLRSYAAAYGYVIQDRAFEEYLPSQNEEETFSSVFNVYWPIRTPGEQYFATELPAAPPATPAPLPGAADAAEPAESN